MRVNSLAFRLIATSAAWMLMVLPIAGFLLYNLYRDDVEQAFNDDIGKLVDAISLYSMSGSGEAPIEPRNLYEPLLEQTHSGWYWQIKPLDEQAGRPLVSASLATGTLESAYQRGIAPDSTGTRWLDGVGPAGEPIRMAEIVDTIGHVDGRPQFSIIVAGPLEWLDTRLSGFLWQMSGFLAVTGLGLLAVALVQVGFGLRPLRRIEQGLAAIRSGGADRLAGELPAEIEPLQHELNALIQSNQDIIERARTQVGNLAHALKTPLAVITNEAREDKGPLGAKVVEQAGIMRDQINYYLDRARVAARIGAIGRVTEVGTVVEPLVRALERIHRDREVVIKVECPAGLRFQGERQDLEEVMGNLLDNACKWARREVALTVASAGGDQRGQPRRLLVVVEDDGPGLDPEQRARIGKRGLRLDETKPGSGLGLSIVSELVQSYRGRLDLGASPKGGLAVRLELPSV